MLLAAVPVGVFHTDPRGGCVYTNPRWQEAAGLDAEQALGDGWFRAVHPRDVERFRAQWQEAVQAKAAEIALETRYLTPRGDLRWVRVCAAAVRSAGGELLGYVGTTEDATERKRVERMRQDLLSMLSHDLKNPLTAVLGFAEILRDAPPDDPQREEFLARIEANAHSALTLAINFVDASRIESGSLQARLEPLSVNEMVEHVLRHQESRARVNRIRLEARLDASSPSAVLDRRLIDRVLANLVNNAIKFSPPDGRVLVETAVVDGRVRIRVQDEGPGIAPELRAKLFQRSGEIGTRRVDSTGLGLFIVKTLVDVQGGAVNVAFPPEGGTIFEVSFAA